MIALSLEGRYARALFSSSDRYEKILSDLESLYIFFQNNRSLYRLLCGTSLKKESRFLIAANTIKNLGLDEALESFLKILIHYNRLSLLSGIKDIYRNMINDVLNRVHFVI